MEKLIRLHMLLNVFCRDKGWLFEDIKQHFSSDQVEASDLPKPADGWICVRSSEIKLAPRLDRTIVQVHDLVDHDMNLFNKVAGVSFMHPMQHWMWKRAGFKGRTLICPIGSREGVVVPDKIPEKPTLGFFCGESQDLRKGGDIFEKAVQLARREVTFDCLLIGRNLAAFSSLGVWEDRAAGINDYQKIDVLFCASTSPAVPLSVYEAQRAGKIVISTPRWLPSGNWPGIRFGDSYRELSRLIVKAVKSREKNFDNRNFLARSPYLLEGWVKKNIDFSIKCISQESKI